MKKLSEIITNKKGTVIPFGFENEFGGGARFGDLAIIYGDTDIGKTTFALNMAANAASAGFPVLFISGEDSIKTIAKRILSIKNDPDIPIYIQDKFEGSYDDIKSNGISIIFFDRYCGQNGFLRDCKELAIENNWCIVEVICDKRRDIYRDPNASSLIIDKDVADVVYGVNQPILYDKSRKRPDIGTHEYIEISYTKGRRFDRYNMHCEIDWETGVIKRYN